MKALKSLNICYKKNLNDEFSNHVSSFTNNLFEYEHHDELIELINTNEIHFVITKYNFELLKKIRVLNNQIQIIAILDELNTGLKRYKLDTRLRQAHFMAQAFAETGAEFKLIENFKLENRLNEEINEINKRIKRIHESFLN